MPDREIGLVDTTVRDGHQSLWSANALSTPMIAEIAPVLDRVGFHAVDFTSSTHMAMAVRWHREDPWERIRVVRELMPETRLGFITPGMRFMAWWRAPVDVMRLALACVIRNGVRRIWVAESMNDVTTDLAIAEIVRDEGAEEVVVGLVYSISPVHTDDYYAERARAIAASPHVDVLNLKDPGGLLTPERVRTLVPALRAAAPNLPLEVHSHMTATMGAACYARSRRAGCLVPLHRSEAARERHVAAFGGADDREPARAGVSRRPRRRRAARGLALLHEPCSRARSARRLSRRVRRLRLQAPAAGRDDLDAPPPARRDRHGASLARHPRRASPRSRRAGLADHGHAAVAVRRRPGVSERHRRRALVATPGRGDPLRARPVWPACR